MTYASPTEAAYICQLLQPLAHITYCIAQKFDGEKL